MSRGKEGTRGKWEILRGELPTLIEEFTELDLPATLKQEVYQLELKMEL